MGVSDKDKRLFYEQLRAVMRVVRLTAEAAYSAFDVGTAQAKLLRHLGEESAISQADLARATSTAPTLTGRALEPLVNRGWVRRTRSTDDRRQYLLELTATGRRARAQVLAAREQIIQRIGDALDERDLADFDRTASKILAALQAGE